MASHHEFDYLSEWEFDEKSSEMGEESGIGSGEEAGRPLTRNENAWDSCDKLKVDAKYHERYIPLQDAIEFRVLSYEDKEKFIKEKSLTDEDRMFLDSEQALNSLKTLSDAVVCISVNVKIGKLASSQAYGTGFLITVNNESAVITNSHSIRTKRSGNGVDFRVVKPRDVRVISFYDGGQNDQITHEVLRIDRASPPDKNKEENVLNDTMKGQLHGGEQPNQENGAEAGGDVGKCDVALELLSEYFNRRDAFLDYALLYLKPLENDQQKALFAKVKPLEMKAFEKLENFRNVTSFGMPDPRRSKYPRSLRLFSISHPHRMSKQVSFGAMLSSLTHVYFLNMAYGQHDTGMLAGKDPFTEHSVATCRGSSGAPIFVYIVNHETGKIVVEECVYFLHFYGGEAEGNFCGKSVSFATIIKNLQLQATHNELRDALGDVKSSTSSSSGKDEKEGS